MKWYSVKDNKPDPAKTDANRILIYTPDVNSERDKYRLIEIQFLKICSDATHFAYIYSPEDKNENLS